ncbi:hypothetical protein F5Y19DRAFT_489713 [Xylariaceae sp. FL1651]|nr:hypothetical protein F5Y19DRAFT_489713 [Xylariaceae sp. FL1651]
MSPSPAPNFASGVRGHKERDAKAWALKGSSEKDFETNLGTVGPRTNTEYDELDAALGLPFRKGDSTSILQLQRAQVRFNQKLIRVIEYAIQENITLNTTKLSLVTTYSAMRIFQQ